MDGEEFVAAESFEHLGVSPVEHGLHAEPDYTIRSGWYMLDIHERPGVSLA